MAFNRQPRLANEQVRLQPLQASHFDALYQVAKDPLIWEQHPNNDRYQEDAFGDFFEDAMASQGALIVINKADQAIIGSSRFQPIEKVENAIEIGWSFLARDYWGGAYNRSIKSLMIDYAFEVLDKVVFYIGKDNIRSQKAVEKIGGVKVSKSDYPQLVKREAENFTYLITKNAWNSSKLAYSKH